MKFICIIFLCATICGCASPSHRGMTRLEVLQLLVEIDQRDQNGMKPEEKSDLLRAQLSVEKMRSRVSLSAYEKCQRDFRDLEMENAGIRAANEFMNKRLENVGAR